MKASSNRLKLTILALVILSGIVFTYWHSHSNTEQAFVSTSSKIKQHYENNLFTLSVYKQSHFGLRMYRQTLDPKYTTPIRLDVADMSLRLDKLAHQLRFKSEMDDYVKDRLAGYKKGTDERSKLRYAATKNRPEYFYIALDLLHHIARLDDYGLKHKKDAYFRSLLRNYDFQALFTDKVMTRAWAAQLANQAYWLKQIGEKDYTQLFVQTLKDTYPDHDDYKLSEQQFGNKLYGMTHVIIADSGYYQHTVKESDHPWIYAYFRKNIDDILANAKEDIIAEIGLSFKLAGLSDDPIVQKIESRIYASVNQTELMVPSHKGDFNFSLGEHRNVLAIMLLDWQQPNSGPSIAHNPEMFQSLPLSIVAKAE
ncbi:DUF3541 domain-containing protein [Vibrio gallicus]|uniref:DUF3541 domain-containing protein n=1 Tax=Vibrio gallicus TaxID=190897 RepID=UPI0021C3056B|nr:DUF3541 domain-containing protein [Vibrio gallicus]